MSQKLNAGEAMPIVSVATLGGGEAKLGGTSDRWRAIFVYRGLHCPICKGYLGKIEAAKGEFEELNTDLIMVSGDTEEKATAFKDEVGLSMPVGYDMSVDQMRELGLYITQPRETETDRLFPEPGLFVINPEGQVHIIEIANAPFIRPDPALILRGLKHIQTNGYPIRGTVQ
jgi:peroxiredoxin